VKDTGADWRTVAAKRNEVLCLRYELARYLTDLPAWSNTVLTGAEAPLPPPPTCAAPGPPLPPGPPAFAAPTPPGPIVTPPLPRPPCVLPPTPPSLPRAPTGQQQQQQQSGQQQQQSGGGQQQQQQ
jgi:hypothetical protein